MTRLAAPLELTFFLRDIKSVPYFAGVWLVSNRLTLCATGACLLLLSACATAHKPPASGIAITPAPVATRSAGGDVTVYSLDSGEPVAPVPATPATTPPPSPPSSDAANPATATPAPSIKHRFFDWFHGAPNDVVAPTPLTAAPVNARPPSGSQTDESMMSPVKPATKPDDGSPPTATRDMPSDADAAPQAPPESRMLTGKTSQLMTADPVEPMADAGSEAGKPDATGAPVRIYFRHNQTGFAASDADAIRQLATNQAATHLPVQVEGHASIVARTSDPVRRAIINLKVAMDRAMNVTNALIRDGVPAEAIQTIAFGDTRPSLAIDGRSEEDASRRVEIYTVNSRVTDIVSTF